MRQRGQRLRRRADPEVALAGPSSRIAEGSGSAAGSDVGTIARRVLDLQRDAGNRAVAAEIGTLRNGRVVVGGGETVATHPSGPPDGARQIMEAGGGKARLGRTVASIDPSPPLLRSQPPTKTDKGWTARATAVRVPEPYLEQFWVTAGRHERFPHIFLDVSGDWEQTIKAGEDEHVADTMSAWRQTWGLVGDLISKLTAEDGSPQPTEDAARADLWRRFCSQLPADLRPAKPEFTDDAQRSSWGYDPDSTLFRQLFGATVLRDGRGWHSTGTEPDEVRGENQYSHVTAGTSQIGGVTTYDLLAEVRSKAGRTP